MTKINLYKLEKEIRKHGFTLSEASTKIGYARYYFSKIKCYAKREGTAEAYEVTDRMVKLISSELGIDISEIEAKEEKLDPACRKIIRVKNEADETAVLTYLEKRGFRWSDGAEMLNFIPSKKDVIGTSVFPYFIFTHRGNIVTYTINHYIPEGYEEIHLSDLTGETTKPEQKEIAFIGVTEERCREIFREMFKEIAINTLIFEGYNVDDGTKGGQAE